MTTVLHPILFSWAQVTPYHFLVKSLIRNHCQVWMCLEQGVPLHIFSLTQYFNDKNATYCFVDER